MSILYVPRGKHNFRKFIELVHFQNNSHRFLLLEYHLLFHFPMDKVINNIHITIYLSNIKDILKSSFTNIIIIHSCNNNKMFFENSKFKNKICLIRIPI